MLKAAIEKLLELAPVNVREVLSRTYADRAIFPVVDPCAAPLEGHTLSGIKSFLATEKIERPVVHVLAHNSVNLVSELFGQFRQRETLFKATAYPVSFQFGSFYALEDMVIALQSCFVQTETTKELLALIGNISDGQTTNYDDDGVSQSVNVKAGITKKATAKVPNPVVLAPFRTFPEIIQPESRFVFRIKSDGTSPRCAIFEADGGAWKNDATGLIKGWFEANLPVVNVIA